MWLTSSAPQRKMKRPGRAVGRSVVPAQGLGQFGGLSGLLSLRKAPAKEYTMGRAIAVSGVLAKPVAHKLS